MRRTGLFLHGGYTGMGAVGLGLCLKLFKKSLGVSVGIARVGQVLAAETGGGLVRSRCSGWCRSCGHRGCRARRKQPPIGPDGPARSHPAPRELIC